MLPYGAPDITFEKLLGMTIGATHGCLPAGCGHRSCQHISENVVLMIGRWRRPNWTAIKAEMLKYIETPASPDYGTFDRLGAVFPGELRAADDPDAIRELFTRLIIAAVQSKLEGNSR